MVKNGDPCHPAPLPSLFEEPGAPHRTPVRAYGRRRAIRSRTMHRSPDNASFDFSRSRSGQRIAWFLARKCGIARSAGGKGNAGFEAWSLRMGSSCEMEGSVPMGSIWSREGRRGGAEKGFGGFRSDLSCVFYATETDLRNSHQKTAKAIKPIPTILNRK